MRILYHHRTRSKDGQAVHIGEMLAAFRGLGHEIRVVEPEAGEQNAFGSDGGFVAKLKSALPGAAYEILEFGYSLAEYFQMSRACRDFRPDVIYERYNLYTLSGIWAAKRHGIPLILEVNAPLFDERSAFGGLSLAAFARWTEDTAWRRADAVLPVTKVLADRITQSTGPRRHVVVVPNGINPEEFAGPIDSAAAKARLGLDGRLVLGFTGFVREWHRVERVLEFMASDASPPQSHFILVGDGPAKEGLISRAAALGLADRASFPGVVPRDAIRDYVAAFDVALQPHVVPYASPLKLFEYMALGRAILAPDTDNIREILVDGRDALLFDTTDDNDFRSKLAQLAGDPALRERLGKAASMTVETEGLTWHRNAERVSALAEKLLAEPGR